MDSVPNQVKRSYSAHVGSGVDTTNDPAKRSCTTSPDQPNFLSIMPTHARKSLTPLISKEFKAVHRVQSQLQPLPLLDSDFLKQCQNHVQKYLHTSYDGSPVTADNFRIRHGAQHQSRAALWALILLQMRRDAGDQEALAFPNKWIKALVITCLLHDSGRKADGADRPEWEAASAQNSRNTVNQLMDNQKLAEICHNAIIHKDTPEQFPHRSDKNACLLRSLLHDADTLDVIRTRTDFQLEYLESYQLPGIKEKVTELAKDVRDIISAQHDLVSGIAISQPDQHQHQHQRKVVASKIPANYNETFKADFELADNALERQLSHLAQCKPQRFATLSRAGLVSNPPLDNNSPIPSTLSQMVKLGENLGVNAGNEVGLHRDLVNGQHWYVKTGTEAAVRHEKLMCDLARCLGMDVPECHLHQEAGGHYFLSKWRENLTDGKEALTNVSVEQKAQLMLVMALLGNFDGIGGKFSNTMVDNNGRLVAIDWGQAGPLSCCSNPAKRKGQLEFSSTPHELELLRDPHTEAMKGFIQRGILGWNPKTIEHTAEFFKPVNESRLAVAARQLLQADHRQLNELIEETGPTKVVERNLLKQTIADRIAWLALRFPGACDDLPITPAEVAAIQASGVRGYSRQMSTKDVENGQIRFFQRQQADNTSETVAHCYLTPSAAERLAISFGATTAIHHALGQLDFYRNTVKQTTLSEELRCDLDCFVQRLTTIEQNINETNDGQWQFHHSGDRSDKASWEEVKQSLTNAINSLHLVLNSEQDSGVNLSTLPDIPFTVIRLPGRVAPVAVDASKVELAEFKDGFAQLRNSP
ncbi:hypothetical protein [Endozoicomonas ascidiicola]|uniref:hypothetical protein n=1 Tax=Endozoicomonas ascidiicola TaxID=1698521 RepID=UPI000832EA77|nr:hypothetical protein [Endozoicomonas ascidiicola]